MQTFGNQQIYNPLCSIYLIQELWFTSRVRPHGPSYFINFFLYSDKFELKYLVAARFSQELSAHYVITGL